MIYELEVKFTDEQKNRYQFKFGTHYHRNKEVLNRKLQVSEKDIIEYRMKINILLINLFKGELEC